MSTLGKAINHLPSFLGKLAIRDKTSLSVRVQFLYVQWPQYVKYPVLAFYCKILEGKQMLDNDTWK